jgi:hypothetical protein
MSNRNYVERQGEARFAVDLSNSALRIRQHRKSGVEYIIGAFMWCVSKGDHTSASLLRSHRRCVDEDDEQQVCTLCNPNPFRIEDPLLSIRESIIDEVLEEAIR